MVLSNGWIETDNLEKLTEDNICTFCKADEEECGEWRECCYIQAIKEKVNHRLNNTYIQILNYCCKLRI